MPAPAAHPCGVCRAHLDRRRCMRSRAGTVSRCRPRRACAAPRFAARSAPARQGRSWSPRRRAEVHELSPKPRNIARPAPGLTSPRAPRAPPLPSRRITCTARSGRRRRRRRCRSAAGGPTVQLTTRDTRSELGTMTSAPWVVRTPRRADADTLDPPKRPDLDQIADAHRPLDDEDQPGDEVVDHGLQAGRYRRRARARDPGDLGRDHAERGERQHAADDADRPARAMSPPQPAAGPQAQRKDHRGRAGSRRRR